VTRPSIGAGTAQICSIIIMCDLQPDAIHHVFTNGTMKLLFESIFRDNSTAHYCHLKLCSISTCVGSSVDQGGIRV